MSEHHTNSTRPMGLALKALMACCLITATTMVQANVLTISPGGGRIAISDPLSGRIAEMKIESGSLSLQFSNGTIDPGTGLPGVPTTVVGGLVSALNVGKVEVTPVGDVTITEDILPIGGRVQTPTRANIGIESGISALTIENTTGQFLVAQYGGGVRLTADFLAGVGGGGEAVVSNLRFDLVGKKVYADLVSRPGTDAEFAYPGYHLWDFDSFTGPTALSAEALARLHDGDPSLVQSAGFIQVPADGNHVLRADNLIKGLRVTAQGFNFFAGALGLTEGSTGYTTLNGVNSTADGWGSISSTFFVSSQIPEPSTYALMGLGLVGMAAAARRRTKAEKVHG